MLHNGESVINPITCEPEIVDVVLIIPTADLPEDKRAAIVCIKEGKYDIEVESYERLKAWEMLDRHLGMFKDRIDVAGSLETEKTKIRKVEGRTKDRLGTLALFFYP